MCSYLKLSVLLICVITDSISVNTSSNSKSLDNQQDAHRIRAADGDLGQTTGSTDSIGRIMNDMPNPLYNWNPRSWIQWGMRWAEWGMTKPKRKKPFFYGYNPNAYGYDQQYQSLRNGLGNKYGNPSLYNQPPNNVPYYWY